MRLAFAELHAKVNYTPGVTALAMASPFYRDRLWKDTRGPLAN